MELTIVLSVSKGSDDYDILDTLESLPWSQEGVDLIVYSEDSGRLKKVLKESDLESTIRDGKVGVVLCETPEEDSYHTIGLEDTKTEEVMFLEAGDIIEDFQGDLFTTSKVKDVGIPGLGEEGTPETVICHETRSLPENYRGLIFNTSWLRENELTEINSSLTARVSNVLISKISNQDYWGGWSDFDISESLSINRISCDDDKETIKSLEEFWKSGKHSYSSYLRDIVWTRINTSAARIITSGEEDALNFQCYLYPASKLMVLN